MSTKIVFVTIASWEGPVYSQSQVTSKPCKLVGWMSFHFSFNDYLRWFLTSYQGKSPFFTTILGNTFNFCPTTLLSKSIREIALFQQPVAKGGRTSDQKLSFWGPSWVNHHFFYRLVYEPPFFCRVDHHPKRKHHCFKWWLNSRAYVSFLEVYLSWCGTSSWILDLEL